MSLTPIIWDGKPISRPGVYAQVPMSVYHGPNLCIGPSISSSGLRTIFQESPMDYWIRSPYNSSCLTPVDSRAFIIGRACHHLCLGEADFQNYFIVRPEKYPDDTEKLKPWTRAAGYCKQWEAEREEDGLSVLTPAELEMIKGLAGIQPWQKGLEDSGLMNSALIRAGALQGLIEHTIVCQDKETGVWLKARPDVIPIDSTEANDLKTTVGVSELALTRTLDDYRYDMQASLISRCLEGAADIRLTNFGLIFVCKPEPHEVAVRELKPYDLDESALDNQTAIRMFALCMEKGKWPGIGGGESDARYLERSDRSRDRARDRRERISKEIFG